MKATKGTLSDIAGHCCRCGGRVDGTACLYDFNTNVIRSLCNDCHLAGLPAEARPAFRRAVQS